MDFGAGEESPVHIKPPLSLPAAPTSPGKFFTCGNSRIGALRAQKGEAILQQRLLSSPPNGNAFMSREKSFPAAQFKEEKGKKKKEIKGIG